MKFKFIIVVAMVFSALSLTFAGDVLVGPGNLTIKKFGFWPNGELFVRFNEANSDGGWFNGFRFSTEYNTDKDKQKETVALLTAAMTNGWTVDAYMIVDAVNPAHGYITYLFVNSGK